MNLELEENEGIIGEKPNFDQDRDWKAKGGISAGLFTLNSRSKAIRWSHLLFWSEFYYESFRNSAAICFHRQQNLISVSIWNSLEFFLKSWLWQYGLWSFQVGGTKLERFLHKNQHTQRKLLNFEFWINGELSKVGHHFSNKLI